MMTCKNSSTCTSNQECDHREPHRRGDLCGQSECSRTGAIVECVQVESEAALTDTSMVNENQGNVSNGSGIARYNRNERMSAKHRTTGTGHTAGGEMEYLTIEQLAAMLSVSKKAILNWHNARRLPYVKCGRLLRFPKREINKRLLSGKLF